MSGMTYVDTRQAADYLGLSPRTLERWRVGGGDSMSAPVPITENRERADRWMSPHVAAHDLRISLHTLADLTQTGRIGHSIIDGQPRYSRRDLTAYQRPCRRNTWA